MIGTNIEGEEIMKHQDELRNRLIEMVEEFNKRTGMMVQTINIEIARQPANYQCQMIVKF